ncbi:hypothetical protein MASR2M78_25080 [Treponema sp.]
MRIFAFSPLGQATLDLGTRRKLHIEQLPLEALNSFQAQKDDIVYLINEGLDPAALRKALNRLKKMHKTTCWGIIDSDDSIRDPAALFQDGASDYVSSSLLSDGLDANRFKRVLSFKGAPSLSDEAGVLPQVPSFAGAPSFPGWKNLQEGDCLPFYFLYAGIDESAALKTKIGERRFADFSERLRQYLVRVFAPSDSLAWIWTESSYLFLVPAEEARARIAAEACIRCLINLHLLSCEYFALETPPPLIFALHRGETVYKPPLSTGTVVSEDVNFIHHLGVKRAEKGRLSITGSAFSALPPRLGDLFIEAGIFEGHQIRASRRFM